MTDLQPPIDLRVHLDRDGLELFIGPLEAAVMRAMWDRRQSTRAIYRHVREHYAPTNTEDLAFTSVTSTVDRLYKRGWINRQGTREAYIYQPKAKTESEFITPYIKAMVGALLAAYPREVLQLVAKHVNGTKKG